MVAILRFPKTRYAVCASTLLLVAMLTGCVTTKTGGFQKASTKTEAVETRVKAAKQYLQNRDFESARRHLKIAHDMAPKSPSVHDAMALTFHYSGEFLLAEKHYANAVQYGKGESRFRVNYANFLFQMEEYDKAEKQLSYVVADSLYEKRTNALMLLGLTQQQLLKTAEAKRSFEQALVLQPNNTRVLRELAIMNYEEQSYQTSWVHFQRFRKRVAQPSAEMLLLGIQLAKKLEQADAEASYILALKNLYPDSKQYRSYLNSKRYE